MEELGETSTHKTSHVETTKKEIVTEGPNQPTETSSTQTTVAVADTTATIASTETTSTSPATSTITTTTTTSLTTSKTRKTTTTPPPLIIFPVNESFTENSSVVGTEQPRKTTNDIDVVTTTEITTTIETDLGAEDHKHVTTEISVTENLLTTSSPDQAETWITEQTETTNIATDDDNEDKSTTATTETPQSTTLEFTEGEISAVILTLDQDAETEQIFLGGVTTADPEEVTTTDGRESQGTTTLSDLITGTFSTAELTEPSDDVTTAGEMINSSASSEDDIADEEGGDTSTISSGGLTTSQPELITQNYKIIFAPSTEPVITIDTTAATAQPDGTETTTEGRQETSTAEPCPGSVLCDGVCLARQQVCDSLLDCPGGEDEEDCEAQTCLPSEFSCQSGRCLPPGLQCDGRPDCPAGEDEAGCDESCGPGEFLCGEGRCVGRVRLCDGVEDCAQGEDEQYCQCLPGQVTCQYGGGCVDGGLLCDGRHDCPDMSDEWDCLAMVNTTLMIRSPSQPLSPVCSDQWSDDWSSQSCKQLGYFDQAQTTTSYDFNLVDSDFWYRNISVPTSGNLVQRSFADETLTCRSKEKVELSCSEFGKVSIISLHL